MKPRYSVITFLLAITAISCSENVDDHAESSNRSDPKPFELAFGIYTNGTPFFDWQEKVRFRQQATGTLHDREGATLSGSFDRPDGTSHVTLNIKASLTRERYSVTGDYDASIPFNLTFLGSADQDEDAETRQFKPGKGKVLFSGSAPYTYDKK